MRSEDPDKKKGRGRSGREVFKLLHIVTSIKLSKLNYTF